MFWNTCSLCLCWFPFLRKGSKGVEAAGDKGSREPAVKSLALRNRCGWWPELRGLHLSVSDSIWLAEGLPAGRPPELRDHKPWS